MTGLLQEIEREAADGKNSVANVLRKCQILAARLGNAEFIEWTDHELSGYPGGSELPAYRRDLRTLLMGDFQNLAYRASRFTLPTGDLRPEVREMIETQSMGEGVAELEQLPASAQNGAIKLYVDQRLWPFLPIMEGYGTLNIWRELSANQIAGLLDQIRNRALAFALQIEKLDPRAGDSPGLEHSVAPEVVSHLFNATMMGETIQYAPGSVGAIQTAVQLQTGDLLALRARLKQLGITDDELAELEKAIKEDGKRKGQAPGPKVSAWIGRVTVRVAAAMGGVGGQTAAGVIAAVIARYLGIA
jgi:hypothetical protein